jgi:hypothetical protein
MIGLLASILGIVLAMANPPAQGGQVWLAPQASVSPSPLNRAADFMQMFTPDAPWKSAAAHVAVFKLYGSFLSRASQDQVNTIVADLNRRGIAIALETGVMNIGPQSTNPPCGGLGLVEGYGTPALAQNISQKIKAAGGTLAYLAMDEPLWYGHYFKGRPGGQPGCQSAIPDIIKLIQPTLAVYRAAFPDALIGDIEPTVIAEQPGWQNDVDAWANGYRQANGKPLAFMHLDIPWARANANDFAVAYYRFCEQLQMQGLIGALGIIYDGTPEDTTDSAWVRDAEGHIDTLQNKDGLRPQQAIIQSWMINPTHAMPDTSPDTLTGLVNFYAHFREQY